MNLSLVLANWPIAIFNCFALEWVVICTSQRPFITPPPIIGKSTSFYDFRLFWWVSDDICAKERCPSSRWGKTYISPGQRTRGKGKVVLAEMTIKIIRWTNEARVCVTDSMRPRAIPRDFNVTIKSCRIWKSEWNCVTKVPIYKMICNSFPGDVLGV